MPHHLIKHLAKNQVRAGLEVADEVVNSVAKSKPKKPDIIHKGIEPEPLVDLNPRGGPVIYSQKRLDEMQAFREKDIEARRNGRGGTGELFLDDEGDIFRTDQKGTKANGEIIYSFRNQTNKNEQNAKIPGRRNTDAELTTRKERDFYRQRSDADADAHHIAELRRSARLYEGLSDKEVLVLDRFFSRKGVSMGDTLTNRAELSKSLHKEFHSWFDQKYPRRRASLKKLTLKQRKEEIGKFLAEYKAANEKIFSMRQSELRIRK